VTSQAARARTASVARCRVWPGPRWSRTAMGYRAVQQFALQCEVVEERDVGQRGLLQGRMRQGRRLGVDAVSDGGQVDPLGADQDLDGCVEAVEPAAESGDHAVLLA